MICKSDTKEVKPTPVDAKTDLDKLLGATASKLKSNAASFLANAGQNATLWLMQYKPPTRAEGDASPAAGTSWITDAVMLAQGSVSVEGIVVIADDATRADIQETAALREKLINTLSRRVWFILACRGIKAEETWAKYIEIMTALQKDIVAPATQLTPMLFGNEPGILAGRLCNNGVTLADSPARVATGAVLQAGTKPSDKSGDILNLATVRALNNIRLSVISWYEDYEGLYWADGVTLDKNGGDFQAIEYLRVSDEVARRVRLMAIAKIADRSLNSTPASIAAHKQLFSRPMRDMSKSAQINGVFFPGECMPPKDDSVEINWPEKDKVNIYIVVRPYNCPKDITVSILLDNEDK